MPEVRLELRGDDLFCLDRAEGGASIRRPLTDATLDRLRDWAARYDKAVDPYHPDPDALMPIGREIAAFLDEGDAWLSRCLSGVGEIAFEVTVGGTPDDRGRGLLDVPWELLAPNATFLAAQPLLAPLPAGLLVHAVPGHDADRLRRSRTTAAFSTSQKAPENLVAYGLQGHSPRYEVKNINHLNPRVEISPNSLVIRFPL